MDKIKVGLMISLLTGSVLAEASIHLERSSPLLSDLEEFLQAVSMVYADLFQSQTAEMQTLRQGLHPLS